MTDLSLAAGFYLMFGLGLTVGTAAADPDFNRLGPFDRVFCLAIFTVIWPLLVWRSICS